MWYKFFWDFSGVAVVLTSPPLDQSLTMWICSACFQTLHNKHLNTQKTPKYQNNQRLHKRHTAQTFIPMATCEGLKKVKTKMSQHCLNFILNCCLEMCFTSRININRFSFHFCTQKSTGEAAFDLWQQTWKGMFWDLWSAGGGGWREALLLGGSAPRKISLDNPLEGRESLCC